MDRISSLQLNKDINCIADNTQGPIRKFSSKRVSKVHSSTTSKPDWVKNEGLSNYLNKCSITKLPLKDTTLWIFRPEILDWGNSIKTSSHHQVYLPPKFVRIKQKNWAYQSGCRRQWGVIPIDACAATHPNSHISSDKSSPLKSRRTFRTWHPITMGASIKAKNTHRPTENRQCNSLTCE